MVTFTRAVPILVYEPEPVTTFSPAIAGTEKLCVPELVLAGELVCGELVCGELFGCAEAEVGSAAAECECVGMADDAGALVSADVGEPPGVLTAAVGDPFAAGADVTAEGFEPLVPHAVSPAPQMTAAMITAETRHILMLQPLDEQP